jgi:hypothetical protein
MPFLKKKHLKSKVVTVLPTMAVPPSAQHIQDAAPQCGLFRAYEEQKEAAAPGLLCRHGPLCQVPY